MTRAREWVVAAVGVTLAGVVAALGRSGNDAALPREPSPTWVVDATSALPSPRAPTAWRPLELRDLEWHGPAFGRDWSRGALFGQTPISGGATRLLNSFHGGDDTTGWVLSATFDGDLVVRGRVGGGKDCNRVYVAVLRDGAVSQQTCGANSEALRPFSLTVPAGGRLVIADFAQGGWGHLLVSDLEVEVTKK